MSKLLHVRTVVKEDKLHKIQIYTNAMENKIIETNFKLFCPLLIVHSKTLLFLFYFLFLPHTMKYKDNKNDNK